MNKINDFYKINNHEEYNVLCVDCPYNCKQSPKSKIISCKLMKKKGMKISGTRQDRKKD